MTDPGGCLNGIVDEVLQHTWSHADILDVEQGCFVTEQPENDFFAVDCDKDGNPQIQVYAVFATFEQDACVLVTALLGDGAFVGIVDARAGY